MRTVLNTKVGQQFGGDGQRCRHRIHHIKDLLLVLLQITVIGERQSLNEHAQGHETADHPPGLATDQLRDIRVFFLGHDGGAGTEAIGNIDKGEFLTGPEHQLLGEPGEMELDQGAAADKLDGKIPVAGGIHGVGGNGGKAEEIRHLLPINGQTGPGQGRGSPGA